MQTHMTHNDWRRSRDERRVRADGTGAMNGHGRVQPRTDGCPWHEWRADTADGQLVLFPYSAVVSQAIALMEMITTGARSQELAICNDLRIMGRGSRPINPR
jgi:hypothetical protein